MTDHDHPDDVQIMLHLNPVRGELSDLEIDVRIPDVDDALERLVVRQVDETLFEVCCLPYTLYGLSLGDVVQVAWLSRTSPGVVGHKVSSSGRSLYRVAFAGPDPVAMQSLASSLVSMGHLVEVWSPMMLAVDGADDEADVVLRGFLEQGHQAGQWQYEVAHIAG